MRSFYSKAASPWKPLYKAMESPGTAISVRQYETHRILVATLTAEGDDEVVGFCDVSTRITNKSTLYIYNPRPYQSGLAVHPDHRTKGIAKVLKNINRNESYVLIGGRL
jgi:GNAT superfamily N-acetyltransferase